MRLIDAEALEESIEQIEWYHVAGNGEMVKGATIGNGWYKEQDIYNAIEEAPTIEVKPVVHGRWIPLTDCANEGVYCSICKKKVWKSDYAQCSKKSRNKLESNYCPNCGATMDEKENDK